MKTAHTLAAWSIAAVLAGFAPQTLAGDGHDHGEAPAPTAGATLPRFTAVSELFELVGVVNGKNVTVYLDRFADNSPVKDARVDLELDGNPVALEPHADGEFEATLPEALKPGVVSITATVIAGQDTDLLAGELDLHEPAAETHEEAAAMDMKPDVIGAGAGALVLVLGLIGWAALREGNSRNRSAGGAA